MTKAKFFSSRMTRIGLKYGIAGSIGAAMASGGTSFLAAPFGEKKEAAKEGALVGLKAGLALTGMWVLRKPLSHAAKAGAREFHRSAIKAGKVMFRRIGGRVVPIKMKG